MKESKTIIQIFHNPRWSKSRGSIELIKTFIEKHSEFSLQEFRYLEEPPNANTLKNLCMQLQVPVQQIIRSSESLFKELGYSKGSLEQFDETHWLKVLEKNPKLIERPIIQAKGRAVIGRPVEKTQEFLEGLLD